MADIFVSYARADRARVAPLVAVLESQGWSVWWDPEIPPGQEFDREIAAELKRAAAVLVVWTPASVASRWVRGEARDGADRGILVPVRFERAELPIDVRALHTIDLDGWDQDPASPSLGPLLRALGQTIDRGRPVPGTTSPSQRPAQPTVATPRASPVAICVLPFVNMSGDPEQEYFSDGITEDVITDLGKVGALFVVARNTAFTYKGHSVDVRQVAAQLGVTHVLEGSVRRSGGRVRITAQLIDGATGGHVWAERYDRALDDIFALQDEISGSIVTALRLKLLPAERQAIEHRGTSNLAAYDFYLRGRQLMRREKETEQRSAAEMFRQAVRLDPQFAQAYAALASVLAHFLHRRRERAPAVLEEARRAGARALELNPDLAQAHVALGMLHQLSQAPDEAARAFHQALARDPRLFDAHYYYARFCVAQGAHTEAVVHYEQAFALEPDDFRPIVLAIQEYQALRDAAGEQSAIQRAWAAIERRLAVDPDDSAAYDHGAGVLVLLGRPAESREFSERAIALRPTDPATHYNAACCAALARDYERALDLLERAVELGAGNREWILNDHDLVPLHDHPRFQALIARLATK